LAAICLVLALAGCGSSSVPATTAGYARGPAHTTAFAFDAHGRLWVTTSGATTHAGDGVYVVERRGATPVKVVSGIRGPLGLVWVGNSLYVSALDGVTKFSGLANGRFARRRLIMRGPVAGAENNNLVLAPNGRLVMGVSATCDHCSTSPRYAGAIVSFRTDGSDLRVMASNVRAAYGLAYAGGILYATFNQRDDLGAKTPGDWLVAVENGQDWRFPECYGQGGAACTGVPSPLATLDPHAAAGGVAVVGGTVVVAEWNAGRVLAVQDGKVRTLLTSLEHPLPVLRAAGDAFLVGDWGSGTIYRVTLP
jgi:glucose/arabinose dehydrogenase